MTWKVLGQSGSPDSRATSFFRAGACALLLAFFLPLSALSDKKASSGEGFAIDLPNSEADVLAAVGAVSEDHIIHGTYVFEREKILNEAVVEKSSTYFGSWRSDGHIFYKVRRDALAPRNFKNSSDIGVISVRYLVHATSSAVTHLEIAAVFVEDGTNRVHASNGTVETSEFGEIQKQLTSLLRDRQMSMEVQAKKDRQAEKAAAVAKQNAEEIARSQAADSSLQALERRARELQHALEVRTSKPNTELKAAPFRGAATLTKLPASVDVLVEIITTYWYGVETLDGHRGWLRREEVVSLP